MPRKYPEDFINKIICGDCLEVMKEMPDECVDMVLTSPPYGNLRDYGGYSFDFKNTAKEIFRIMKEGAIMVWITGDTTLNGSESGISFQQVLYFKKIGFNIHDTMIYQKDGMPFPEQVRYNQCFEYMFILSRGKPSIFNPIKEKTRGYKASKSSTTRNPDGTTSPLKYEQGKLLRNKFNIWKYNVGYMKSTREIVAFDHPAIFPDKLALDHIISWSNEDGIILDPFIGSGTTARACKLTHRNFIGIEINPDYCKIADERLSQGVL